MNAAVYEQTLLELTELPGYEPALPLQPPTECGGCDSPLKVLDANDELAPDHLQPAGSLARVHAAPASGKPKQWVESCQDCWDYGYRPPSTPSRAEVVISNCIEHASNGVGLADASAREGYGQPSILDSVLRRWGRKDVSALLMANEDRGR